MSTGNEIDLDSDPSADTEPPVPVSDLEVLRTDLEKANARIRAYADHVSVLERQIQKLQAREMIGRIAITLMYGAALGTIIWHLIK